MRLGRVRRDDKGFTLTELLIVIVILGVLTGIVVFAVGAFTDRGETAACKADKKSVEVAVEAYRAKTGGYPNEGTSAANFKKLTDGEFLRSAPDSDKYTITLEDGGVIVSDPADC